MSEGKSVKEEKGNEENKEGKLVIWRGIRKRKEEKTLRKEIGLGNFGCIRDWLVAGILGSGARKPQGFLELGSQRGSVPSWLGGKHYVFRLVSGKLATCNRKQLRTNFFFNRYFTILLFFSKSKL
jgi:hypothetical protein